MQKKYKIYKHTSPNGKVYIGQTCCSLSKRFRRNGVGYKNNHYFFSAILKYGWDNFTHEVVCDNLTLQEANWLEKYLIAYYHSNEPEFGYNLTAGGEGVLGYRFSAEMREYFSKRQTGKKMPKEVVEKIAAWHRGRKRSNKTKKNISEATKRLYQTPEGKAMASKRAWSKRKVTNGEVTYQSVKETAEAIGIKPDTLRKAIYDGRPMRGYHWSYVMLCFSLPLIKCKRKYKFGDFIRRLVTKIV